MYTTNLANTFPNEAAKRAMEDLVKKGNDDNKKIWESREKSSIESLVKSTFDMMAPVVIEEDNGLKHEFARTFTIHEMDHYQSDIS